MRKARVAQGHAFGAGTRGFSPARQRGGALLAVLWLSAALSAIIFTLAITVRGELERAASALDSTRAYYMAQGAIERFLILLTMPNDPRNPGPGSFRPGQRRMRWDLPAGMVDLEITGESGKLNVYSTRPETLARLFAFLGVDGARAQQIAGAIAAQRSPQAGNFSAGSSFPSQLPSFLQLEDLLVVGGMTPDIYYGWWERDPDGRLAERGGVARHLSVLEGGGVNVNYASAAVLRAVGVPEGAVMAILEEREGNIIESPARFGVASLAGGVGLAGGGSAAYTVRATAQLKDRPVRRTVSALVRFGKDSSEPLLGVVRWYPNGN